MSAAKLELDDIAGQIGREFPLTDRGLGVNLVPLREVALGDVHAPLLILTGAAIFVMLIGCANVSSLVLARGIDRRRELGVRNAIGASTGRLVRQLLTESFVIAFFATLMGTVMALWGSKPLVVSLSQHFALPPITFEAGLLALVVLIALTTGILCGIPSALMASKSHLSQFLKEGGRGHAGGGNETRLQGLLVICETALTIVLMTSAGLMLKSFILLYRTNLGFNPKNVSVAELLLSNRYTNLERRTVFLERILQSVAGLPGVANVAINSDPPFTDGGTRETFHVEGHEDPAPHQGYGIAFNLVSGGIFSTMGMPIKRGSGFDKQNAPVAIVNETMARQFWPQQNPIGKRISFYYDKHPRHWFSIVGVVGDARYRGRDFEPASQVFVPYQQNPYRSLPYDPGPYVSLVVRASSNPTNLIQGAQSDANRQVSLLLSGAFAIIGLLLSISGLYGLISHIVARRTQEIGVRVALGATIGEILTLIMRQGILLTLIGVALGIAGSLTLTKLMSGLLYGITPTDAPTFAGTALLFAAVAIIATYVPARRAATIDPTVAFRCQ